MDDKLKKALTKPFSKDEVKAPPKGKFGSYVPHHLVTKRLNDVAYGEWSHTLKEIVRDSEGKVRGAVTTFTLFGVSHDEVGDVDSVDVKNNNTEGELLKLCMSDALKRGAMRHGIGLHLWTGEVTEEEHYANKSSDVTVEKFPQKSATEDIGPVPTKFLDEDPSDMVNRLREALAFHEPLEETRMAIKKQSWDNWTKANKEKDVSKWTDQDFDEYLDLFVQYQSATPKALIDTVEDVFGEVVDNSGSLKPCPKCGKTEDITDMRVKKSNAPEGSGIKNLPDFMCEKNDPKYRPAANGCGWGGYIGGKGDKEVPSTWL
jgi:hypothetical protein